MGSFDLGLRLRFEIRVNRERDLVGFVDRRWLRFLLGKPVAFLQGLQLEAVYAIQDTVKFLLQALVRAQVQRTPEQKVEGAIEILFGSFEVPSFIVVLPELVFVFNLRNQLSDGIRLNLKLSLYSGTGLSIWNGLRSWRGSCAQRWRGRGPRW